MTEEDYISLIHKTIKGEITDQERSILNAWLQANAENQNLFDDFTKIWKGDWEEGPFKPDSERFFLQREKFAERLAAIRHEEMCSARRSLQFQRIAGVVLVCLSVSLTTMFFIRKQLNQPITVVGGDKAINFNDGGTVYLGDQSVLTITQGPAYVATEFYGDAYFSLSRDSKPIITHLPFGIVTIKGTNFFLKASKGGDVHVISDAVTWITFAEQVVELQSNERAIISVLGGRIKTSKNHDSNFGAWHTGVFAFKESTVKDVIEQLKTRCIIDFEFVDNAILTKRFTGTFINERPENIVAVLANNLNLHYECLNGVCKLSS